MAPGADREYFQKNNPYGMTVSQMRHQYNKQIAEGKSLKDALAWSNSAFNTHVKPSTQWQYLINDTGEDIPGLRTYESLGMENRPLADQFGGVHDLAKIKATLASLFPDNPLYSAEAVQAAEEETETGTGTGTETETPSYLTADDLASWWEGIDKSGFGNQEESKPKPMDDFMKFMMFMSMMQPQRSGGGSRYGYGGLNPGGVMSSYNPLDNISQLISAFGQLPGSSSAGSSEDTSSRPAVSTDSSNLDPATTKALLSSSAGLLAGLL